MVTTKLNLSMTEPQVRQIYAKQGDTGRVLDITLDQTPEDGTLRILRPDGVEVTSEAVTGGEAESGGTFESLTEADVTELSVGIEPVQDLNGYDKPWVGGAGKNKFDVSSYDLTSQWTNVSGVITNVGNPLSGNYIGCSFSGRSTTTLSAGTHTLSLKARLVSGEYTAGIFNALRLHTNGTDIKDLQRVSNPRISNVFQTYYGVLTLDESYTFEDINLQFATGLSNAVFEIKEIQIETGSTPTAWQPYSNICPISGWDSVEAQRTGKNLFDLRSLRGGNFGDVAVFPTGNICTGEYIPIKGGQSYMWSQSLYSDGSSSGRYVRWYDSSKSMVGTESIYTVSANVIQSPANAVYARFMWYQASSFNSIDEIIAREPQLELGSTATAYEPYQGSTYTTSLGQTVYGGTLDMVSGVLTVDKAMVTLDGSETWNVNSATSGLYYTTIANLKDNGLAISNAFEQTTVAGANMANGQFKLVAPNLVNIKTEHTTVTDWKTWLSSNNVQLCYELATPQTYTLTPQQIKTLVGTNNVWASSGDIVNITFTYGGLLSELPSDATSVVGKCYCDVEQNGVSSMPFTLNVKKNERES